ncbi:hypothetical protein [Candidatus Mesenet endosymbiont of Agriotes lineatus]|uniref:hypothetical protein n=1 Tax=Candidatus Mesenet endosymbiont of Agriotes lineatus TaxID=3077948 RepID=UPI0030CB963C
MNEIDEQDLCSNFAKNIIGTVVEKVPSDEKITVDFLPGEGIRFRAASQEWLINLSCAVQLRRKRAIKRSSDISDSAIVNTSNINSTKIKIGLDYREMTFLNEYMNKHHSEGKSQEFKNKEELQEYIEDFEFEYKGNKLSNCDFTDEDYKDFVETAKGIISSFVGKNAREYDRIKIVIEEEALSLCFLKPGQNSCENTKQLIFYSFGELRRGYADADKPNFRNFVSDYNADKAISHIRETLLIPDSQSHTKYVSNVDEALEYLEELPFDETVSQYYNKIVNTTESYHNNTITNNSYICGLTGILAPIIPTFMLLHDTTAANELIDIANTASDDHDKPAYIVGTLSALIGSVVFIGFMFYKYYFQKKQDPNKNPNASVTGTKQLKNFNEKQAESSDDIHISIQEESQIPVESAEQSIANAGSALSITSTGSRSHLSPTTDDQESRMRSTSSEQSITSSTRSSSSQASIGSEQQPQEIITEGSERSQAESLKSSLEEVRVVENSEKPKPKPHNVYLSVCQCQF